MTTTDWLRGDVLAADDLDAAFGRCIDRAGDTMAGLLTLAQDPVGALDAVTLQYLQNYAQQPDAPHTGYTYGRQNGGWTAVLPLGGGTMTGPIITMTPANPGEATNKQYVDTAVATGTAYSGTWQVAANTPNITAGGTVNGQNYFAVTANSSVPETAPASIPGIGGMLVHTGDRIYWSSALTLWQLVPIGPSGTGGASITVGDTPPASPTPGAMWWDSVGTQLYVYYNDGNSNQWVNTTNAGSGAVVACGDTAPSSPGIGTLWFDSTGLQMYVWEFDGNSTQWLPVVNQSGSLAPAVAANTGRNLCHNGTFIIQQRGTGPWTASGNYTADRWFLGIVNDAASISIITLADTDRAAIGDESAQFALQNVFTGSATATSMNNIQQRIENVRRTSGRTVTYSFWAKASSGSPSIYLDGVQSFGTGGSPSANVQNISGAVLVISTTWARYSGTFVMPSVAGKTFGTNNDSSSWIRIAYSNGAGGSIPTQSGTVQIWGVQLEIGAVATPLAKRDPADELALCQRFYFTTIGSGAPMQAWSYATAAGANFGLAYAYPVQMRAVPSVAYSSITYSNSQNLAVQSVGTLNTASVLQSAAAGNVWFSAHIAASADL